jgi:hypothetical protein
VGPETHWRGRPDTLDRRLRWFVLASVLFHAPLTPLLGLLGLVSLLSGKEAAPLITDPLTDIPIDLFEGEDLGLPAPAPAVVAPPEPVEAAEVIKPKPSPKPIDPVDAGTPDAEPPDAAPPDAGPPDASPPDAGPDLADAGPSLADAGSDASVADAGIASTDGGTAPNPMAALTGAAKKVIDQDANVRLVIYPEKIRNHALAPRIGQLLASVYQWRDFFGPAKIDPIRDVDRIMVVGPELRDSKNVAAILKLNVSGTRVREAIDAIVQLDTEHGAWLDAGIPAATAYADRAPRLFVMPSPNTVVVVPPSLQAKALALPRSLNIPKSQGGEVVWAYAVSPWKPARMLGVDLPKSLKWAKIWITPREGGGALVEAEAEDESPESAALHARELNQQIKDLLSLHATVGLLGQMFLNTKVDRPVEHIELSADDVKVRGTATLTQEQIERVFEQIQGTLVRRQMAKPPREPQQQKAP